MEKNLREVEPFENCDTLDGYHCQTNSLAKIYKFHNCNLSEDMLLGLGSGMGFFYWHQKNTPPFVGGRGNLKGFFLDLGKRTGVKITVSSTSSQKRAENLLIEQLQKKVPVMLYGDMGYLPWFDLPEDYHFGGHTFVICGFDGKDKFLASDIAQKTAGLKKGEFGVITKQQLQLARNSKFKPFPPKNAWLEFDFSQAHYPEPSDINRSIKESCKAMLNPPISNAGIKGIRRTALEIGKWPAMFSDSDLRMNLFSTYIFIEVGGTGGGCFRYMYARFLREAAKITGQDNYTVSSDWIQKSGETFSKIGLLFKAAEKEKHIEAIIKQAQHLYNTAADLEEQAFRNLEFI